MTYSEKLVCAGLAASIFAMFSVACIGTMQEVLRKKHPIVRKYEGVYQDVRKMAQEIGE